MKGVIIGDVAGSVYEWKPAAAHTLFDSDECCFTDDTVMSTAITDALLICRARGLAADDDILSVLVERMQYFGRLYPDQGYSRSFRAWLQSEHPQPYGSATNGALMRCTSAGWLADSAEEARRLGRLTALPSHDHPDALAAASLCAELIWRARMGESKDALREIVAREYEIPTLDEIRPITAFDFTCKTTLPIAFAAFYEGSSLEEAVCLAISLGGDTDTNAAIAGALAEAHGGVPEALWKQAETYCPPEILSVVERWAQATGTQV